MKYKDDKVDEKMEAAMTLEDCIDEIIRENFKKGDRFDSHTVIDKMQKNAKYHKVYHDNFSPNCTVNQYHGIIAKKIGENGRVKKDGADSKVNTDTIFGEARENQVWQVK